MYLRPQGTAITVRCKKYPDVCGDGGLPEIRILPAPRYTYRHRPPVERLAYYEPCGSSTLTDLSSPLTDQTPIPVNLSQLPLTK
jgi:hypothetical protein